MEALHPASVNIYKIIRHSLCARRLMEFEYILRYPPTRLRGLDPAIADYFLKNHKLRATDAKPAFAGYTGSIS